MALKLYEVYGHGAPHMWLQDDVQLHPYGHLMAILIMGIKLCCSLDVPATSPSGVHADWQAWSRAVLQRARGPASYPVTTLEVQDPCFSLGTGTSHAWHNGRRAGAPLCCCRQLRWTMQTWMYTSATWSRRYLQEQTCRTPSRTLQQPLRSGAGDRMPSLGPAPESSMIRVAQVCMSLTTCSTANAVQNQAPSRDVVPADHAGLPPWSPPDNEAASQSYRIASKSESAPVQRLGPDYAAVLAACAAYLWLQPDFLHRLVARTESVMLSLEQASQQA